MRDDIYIEATPMTPERGGSGGFYPNPGRDQDIAFDGVIVTFDGWE